MEKKLTGRLMIQFGDNEPTKVKDVYDYECVDFGIKQSPILNDEIQRKLTRKEFKDNSGNSVVFFIENI
jgi:hypothetical protein